MAKENPDFKNVVIAFIGRRYTGKSTHLTEFLVKRDRVITVDPNGEHVWTPNELNSIDELREFMKWGRKKAQWAANFVPGEDIEDDVAEASRIIFDAGDCAVAFDEITEYCSAGHAPKAFSRLVRRGRHRGIDVFYTSLRFAETPRTLTAQTDRFFLFRQSEPSDLEGIAKRFGPEVDGMVQQLGEHEYVEWDIASGLAKTPGLYAGEIDAEEVPAASAQATIN